MQKRPIAKLLAVLLVCSIFSSCTKEKFDPETFDITTYPIYFRSYIAAFIEDAQDLEVNLDPLTNIHFQMVEEIDGNAIANCQYDRFIEGTGDPDNIINVEWDYWLTASYAERKRIVYHELGHCFVDRVEHRNGHFQNDMCISILEGNDGNCTPRSGQVFFCDTYKSYYLRELFFEIDETPEWANDPVEWCYDPQKVWANVYLQNNTGITINDFKVDLKDKDGDTIYGYTLILGEQNELSFDIGDLFEEGDEVKVEISGPGVVSQSASIGFRQINESFTFEIIP